MHTDPTAPPRLKHSTDPADPLAQALSDESLAVGAYDMDGLRGRVLDAARGAPPTGPQPAPPGTSWWKVAVLSGITASLVTFGLVQLLPSDPAPPAVAETFTPSLQTIPLDDTELEPEFERLDESPDAPSDDPAAPPTRVEQTPRVSGTDAAADAPRPGVDALPEQDPTPPADAQTPAERAVEADPDTVTDADSTSREGTSPPMSQLAAELADYNQAVDFDARQDWAAALAAWDVYLDRWPDGRLHTEARLGRLRALVGVDQPAQVERLAGELLATPGLQAQRDDLLLTRAEALVKLDRCDEARSLVADRRRSDPGFDRVQTVRSTCRRR